MGESGTGIDNQLNQAHYKETSSWETRQSGEINILVIEFIHTGALSLPNCT